MTRPQAPTPQVMEVDENVNVVPREVESSPRLPNVFYSLCNGTVRFIKGPRIGA